MIARIEELSFSGSREGVELKITADVKDGMLNQKYAVVMEDGGLGTGFTATRSELYEFYNQLGKFLGE